MYKYIQKLQQMYNRSTTEVQHFTYLYGRWGRAYLFIVEHSRQVTAKSKGIGTTTITITTTNTHTHKHTHTHTKKNQQKTPHTYTRKKEKNESCLFTVMHIYNALPAYLHCPICTVPFALSHLHCPISLSAQTKCHCHTVPHRVRHPNC